MTRACRVPPSPSASPVVALFADECAVDAERLALPHPEIHLGVRFGPSARDGLDVHAMGVRSRVLRKRIRGGQKLVMARLRLCASQAVLGVPASAIAGQIVALDDLWGPAATRRLLDRLAKARDGTDAGAILESSLAERASRSKGSAAHDELVVAAARRLTTASVNEVASDLGVSERHFRRVFHEEVGMSPKAFAKVTRFVSAVRAGRADEHANWANIAVAAGYYDQAHLIAEFRAISGVTPRALMGELRRVAPVG